LKAIFTIIFCCLAFSLFTTLAMWTARVQVNLSEPLAATAIGIVSATLGVLPLVRGGQRNPVTVLQLGVLGTVIHLLAQCALATALIASHAISFHGTSIIWLLGEYWISLAALIWQLRRLILAAIPATGVQH